jgi:hypothetical protein
MKSHDDVQFFGNLLLFIMKHLKDINQISQPSLMFPRDLKIFSELSTSKSRLNVYTRAKLFAGSSRQLDANSRVMETWSREEVT